MGVRLAIDQSHPARQLERHVAGDEQAQPDSERHRAHEAQALVGFPIETHIAEVQEDSDSRQTMTMPIWTARRTR